MKLGELVLVKWQDSTQPIGGWVHMDSLPEPNIINCKSVGWIIFIDKKILVLAPNMGDVDSDINAQCSGIINIPRKCIIGINSLASGEARE